MGSFPFPTPGTFVLLPSYGRTLPHSGAVSRSRCYCSKSCFQFFLSASRNLLADAVNGIMSSMCAAQLCNSTSASSDSSSDCQRVVCTSCRPAYVAYVLCATECLYPLWIPMYRTAVCRLHTVCADSAGVSLVNFNWQVNSNFAPYKH